MIYLVVTSPNNVCLCALNGVVILGYYTLGTAIFHNKNLLFFSLAGPRDKQLVFPIRAKLGLTPKWLMARTHMQVAGAQMVDQVTGAQVLDLVTGAHMLDQVAGVQVVLD